MKTGLKRLGIKLLNALIIVSMTMVYVPEFQYEAHAAPIIGYLNGRGYDDFDDLIDDLEDDYEDSSVTIDMATDWYAAADSDYNDRLIIPKKCNATLNMNGHRFDRDLAWDNDWESNGELICMESGSTLTINGGPKTWTHNVPVYTSTRREPKAREMRNIAGGVLAGGASTNGAGGIHVKSDCKLTLNSVTIAGCRAEQRSGTDGYGGGIWLTGGNTNVYMNDSEINGCYAYNDGGGIYQSNHNHVRIELKNSRINCNCAYDQGGGINPDGEYVYIVGDGNSSVSGNWAGTEGGGIYAWNDDLTISGLIMVDNWAGKNGGAIYTLEETISMSQLIIRNNSADERGGGIYINNDGNTIAGCKITGNRAGISGNGVYVNSDVDSDFKVTADTVIKDNGGSPGSGNLYISDNDPEDSRVMFDLNKGAEVWVKYYDYKNKNQIMVSPGQANDEKKSKDCTQYLHSENGDYYFGFDAAPNMRKIILYKGQREEKPKPTKVPAANANDASSKTNGAANSTRAGVVRKVGAGGGDGNEFDLVRGFYLHENTANGTDDQTGVFYYTDGYFYGDPYTYNPHLGTSSWVLAFAGTYLRKFEDEDENGNTYYNKHAGARQFLADIGCPDQNIYVNDSMVSRPGFDTIGVTIASKELVRGGNKTGDILIPVTIRGGGYEREWASNVTLGTASEMASKNKEAKGFSQAADDVMAEIEYYLKKYKLEQDFKDGKVKFWVSGFSRAGAVANLTAKRLVEKIETECTGTNKSKVFAYPCEAPKGGHNEAEKLSDKTKYHCIHNMINAVDIVPFVGTTQMGFKRYGVDHYIPGGDAGSVTSTTVTAKREDGQGGNVTVTTYADNAVTKTKSDEYNSRRDKMMKHLAAIDSDMIFDDYFHPMAMDFIPMGMYEDGNYHDNMVEDFVSDFVRFLQEGIARNEYSHYSQAVNSRKQWADELQGPMRETMSMVFSMSDEDSSGFINRASSIIDKISILSATDISLQDIYDDVIGDWHTLSDSDKNRYITFFSNKLKDSGAFDFLSAEDQANLERNWPVIANFIFRLTDADYGYRVNMFVDETKAWRHGGDDYMIFVPTFATFASYILMCHYPEINIAWAATYDSYYQNQSSGAILEPTEYEITPPSSVDAPKAYYMAESSDGGEQDEPQEVELKEKSAGKNELRGNQTIILENKNIVGEAVYYDLIDVTNGNTKLSTNELYRGGVELSLGDLKKKDLLIKTYDMSYGVKSGVREYEISLYDDRHDVTVKYANGSEIKTVTNGYKEGQSVAISSASLPDKYFIEWKLTLYDADGNELRDVTDEILGENKTKGTTSFNIPALDAEHGYSIGYSLLAEAQFKDKINKLEPLLGSPVPGGALDEEATIEFGGVDGWRKNYPIVWTYTYNDGERDVTVPASGYGYDDTVYTATIRIPEDVAEEIIFASEVTPINEYDNATIKNLVGGKLIKNPADGSVTLVIEYDKTDNSHQNPRPDTNIPLTIKTYDLNIRNFMTTTVEQNVLQGTTVTLMAPDVEDEVFVQWNLGLDNPLSLADGSEATDPIIQVVIPEHAGTDELSITAEYIPVVSKVEAEIEEPVGGEKMSNEPSLFVTITNTYEVHPDYLELSWSPDPLEDGEDKIADFRTAYTAKITVKPDEQGHIKVRIKGTDTWVTTDARFIFSDRLVAKFNDENAVYDTEVYSISHTFDPTKYKVIDVKQVDPIGGLAHGTDPATALPDKTKIIVDNGIEIEVPVSWSVDPWPDGKDRREANTFNATGTITLPDYVDNRGEVDLTLTTTVSVKEADAAPVPIASLDSGTFLLDQTTTLSTSAEDADIYYTTDGSDPVPGEEGTKKYDGEEIAINRSDMEPDADGKRTFTLKAITVKDGLFNSNVGTYVYVLTDEVPVPKSSDGEYNGYEQIGVGASIYYTLEPMTDGVTIDEDGNAVAKNAGTYKVRAKISDGFKWQIPKEGGGTETTKDDQILTFTISPASIEDAVIEVLENPKRLVNGKAEPKIKVTLNGVELPEGSYRIEFSRNTKKGKASVKVIGTGNFTGESKPVEFEVLPEEYTITYDLNGGTYKGDAGPISKTYEDGTRIRLLGEPVREGYEFDYWEGSKYKAGARYKVTEDHKFTARWKKAGSGSDSGSGARTGDDVRLLSLMSVMLLAALLSILMILRRRLRKNNRA